MRLIEEMLAGALMAALACACSGSIDGGGSGGQSSSGSAGQSSSGSAGQGSGGSNSCAAYDDAPAQAPVTIRITNARPAPVYVDTKCDVIFQFVSSGVSYLSGTANFVYGQDAMVEVLINP